MPDFLAEVLTWPKNHYLAIAVQTAVEMGLPPTLFVLDEKKTGVEWSAADKKLAMAWTILQRETCKQCGQPLWICRSSERDMQFKVNTDICYASAELAKWQDSKRAKSMKKGEYAYIIPFMANGQQFPSRLKYVMELAE